LFKHDLFGKPLHTFPDHALGYASCVTTDRHTLGIATTRTPNENLTAAADAVDLLVHHNVVAFRDRRATRRLVGFGPGDVMRWLWRRDRMSGCLWINLGITSEPGQGLRQCLAIPGLGGCGIDKQALDEQALDKQALDKKALGEQAESGRRGAEFHQGSLVLQETMADHDSPALSCIRRLVSQINGFSQTSQDQNACIPRRCP
jgi:hypothetical protein